MYIITISGLDGSGKSTQIKLLEQYLEYKNKRAYYFHAITFSIANKLKRSHDNKPGQSTGITEASWASIQLRKVFLVIDTIRFKKLKKKLALQGYTHIISDRYFFDGIANINYLSHNKKKLCIERFIPLPHKAFFLNVDPEVIMQRDRAPEQGIDYLKEKNAIYHERIKDWDLEEVDGARDKETIFHEIKNRASTGFSSAI